MILSGSFLSNLWGGVFFHIEGRQFHLLLFCTAHSPLEYIRDFKKQFNLNDKSTLTIEVLILSAPFSQSKCPI